MQPRRQLMFRASRIGATFALPLAAIWACGSDPSTGSQVYGNSGANGGAAGAAGGGGPAGGASGAAGAGISGIGGAIDPGTGGNGGSGPKTDAACAQSTIEAKKTPLDMFIMLDQSGSMIILGQDRWTPVVNAIKQFVASAEMEGVGVGLGYFGNHPPGVPPLDPFATGSCDANDYARPDVPIDVLPNVRMPIEASLNAHSTPGGGTPTHPALSGSMQYATTWAVAHPDRKVIVVLATDGEPQGCTGNDINTVSDVARQGAMANPAINTYVIGVGPSLQNLNRIAQAGGSNMAYLVDAGNTQQFLDAMKQIRGIALGCDYAIPKPDGKLPDFTKVNIYHTPSGGSEGVIYHVTGPNDCGKGGWYYERDGQNNPIGIKVCPDSCKQLVDGGGRIDIQVGCSSIPPPR
jgi:hypothetical protein